MTKKTDNRSDRERIYDEEIFPLMSRICEICERAGVPFAAQFSIGPAPDGDETYLCSSLQVLDDRQIARVAAAMQLPREESEDVQ